MNNISIFFIALVTMALTATIGYLFFSIFKNFQRGVQALESLSARFSYLPASIVLKKLGVSHHDLVSISSTYEVEELIRNCESCQHSKECVKDLKSSISNTEKVMEYCPNGDAFVEHIYYEKLNKSNDFIH